MQSKGNHKRLEQEGHQGDSSLFKRKYRRDTPSRWNQKFKYENSFNGYCFSCNEFGHKALHCEHYERRGVGIPNKMLRYWRCNHFGHIATCCHTMRCYNYNGFGQKAQGCWKSRRHPMNEERKGNESRIIMDMGVLSQ